MDHRFPRSIANILRSTLSKLEQTSDFQQDDLAVIELKRHVIRAIAELEVAKDDRPASAHAEGQSSVP